MVQYVQQARLGWSYRESVKDRTLDAQLLSTAMPLLGACPGPLPNTLLRALQGLYAVPCHAVLLYHDLRPRRPSVGPSHHHHDISRRPLP